MYRLGSRSNIQHVTSNACPSEGECQQTQQFLAPNLAILYIRVGPCTILFQEQSKSSLVIYCRNRSEVLRPS